MNKFLIILFAVASFIFPSEPLQIKDNEFSQIAIPNKFEHPQIKVYATFDQFNLIFKAEVSDKWKNGEGFVISFLAPKYMDIDSTSNFHSFAFPLNNGNPAGALLSRDGKVINKKLDDLNPEIKNLGDKVEYLIKIPWELLYPFHPAVKQLAGINISYLFDDGSKKIISLVDDTYSTETQKYRKYIPVEFLFSKPYAALRADKRLISDVKVPVKLYSYQFDSRRKNIKIFVKDENGNTVSSRSISKFIRKGSRNFTANVKIPSAPGLYKIFAINGDDTLSESVYRVDRKKLSSIKKESKQSYIDINSALKTFSNRDDIYEFKNMIDKAGSIKDKPCCH